MTPHYITLHHSLTKDSGTVSWGAIRRYHMETLHWHDIGYHFGIEQIGDTYEILIGRMMNENGAHCKELNMNRQGLGICIVGNFDNEAPSLEILDKTRTLVRSLMEVLRIPTANVIGHREAGLAEGKDWRKGEFKTCPGKLWDMDSFRYYL